MTGDSSLQEFERRPTEPSMLEISHGDGNAAYWSATLVLFRDDFLHFAHEV